MPARPAPPHPGDVLLNQYLVPRGIVQSHFAAAIGMKEPNLTSFIKGRRDLTARMAWALAAEFNTKPEYWALLQMRYDLWHARPRRARRKRSSKSRRR